MKEHTATVVGSVIAENAFFRAFEGSCVGLVELVGTLDLWFVAAMSGGMAVPSPGSDDWIDFGLFGLLSDFNMDGSVVVTV